MVVLTNASLARAACRTNLASDDEVKHFSLGSTYLRRGDLRLDGRFYAEEAWIARLVVQESGYEKVMLGGETGLADVWMPGRFKRIEVADPELGVPFFTPSEIIQANPKRTRYLSWAQTANVESYIVDEGWILVSRSGTVGRTVVATKALRGTAVSEDAIRVIARKGVPYGFLHAYLAGSIGHSLISKDQYGAVIKHIEPSHLGQIPIPLLPQALQNRIHSDVVEACRLREEANQMLEDAEEMFYRELGLPRLVDCRSLYEDGDVKAFTLLSSELDLRLDGSYYDPPGRHALRIIEQRQDSCDMRDLTERIFHPFRMNMVLVDKEHGVPFLGGGDIIDYRYFGEKYISPITENYGSYLLERGWTLMTIGGTIGRITYVGSQFHGWAASQHVTRIVPDKTEVWPGYLYAYMVSDYGRLQVNNLIYGAVVDTIRESQLETLRVPVPPKSVQEAIHKKVEAAYENRAAANELEDRAIRLLEDILFDAYERRTGQKVTLH